MMQQTIQNCLRPLWFGAVLLFSPLGKLHFLQVALLFWLP